jgi:hypothetical protein
MQIHELNKCQQVNEVDLVGPNSIFNVGKQVLKNPAAMTSSSALGAAKQAASQVAAHQSSDTLIKQGYKVGGSIKPTVTTAQQLQAVKANPAVQQQVKNLAAQWKTQGAAIITGLRSQNQKVSEAVVISNPERTKDPVERKLLDLLYKKEAEQAQQKKSAPVVKGTQLATQPYQVPGAGTNATPTSAAGYASQAPVPSAADQAAVNQDLEEYALAFSKWMDQRLASQGVTMDMVRRDPATNKMLSDLLTKVAIENIANPASVRASEAIEEYLNIAIAGIQAYVNNSAGSQPSTAGSASTSPAASQSEEEQIKQQLDKIGITRSQLGSLGTALAQSNRGSDVINNTGNPLLNAIAKLAGMKIR